MTEYRGSPWRSRFLRGPKIGQELAARDDFVELGDPAISIVQLGLKSGNDDFFFLKLTGTKAPAGRLDVRGLGGWTGSLPRADLLPGIQSPKDLDVEEGRLAAVPTRRGSYTGEGYYFCPRIGRLDHVVREYVQYGEVRNVHQGTLVRSNADASGWFRQTRLLARSRWVLPYNSGYDYGAVDNQAGAILNGRLVGVHPADGIDPDVLGGILNSTFVTLMRLLEGVATGNEGAFDVGPPAARLMRIPDPGKMTPDGLASIAASMGAIRQHGHLPHAPLADATVPQLRQQLDMSVALALGSIAGNAAVLLDRVYSSYARWRAAVEAVEDSMQAHRRALARRGGARSQNPIATAAATVWDEMAPATALLLGDIVGGSDEVLDPKFLKADDPNQGALFAQAVVLDEHRKPFDLGDTRRLEFTRFVRNLGAAGRILIPISPERCQRLLDEAIAAEAVFIEEATRRAQAHVSNDLVDPVVTAVRKAWIGKSIARLQQMAQTTSSAEDEQQDPSLFDIDGLCRPSHQLDESSRRRCTD